MTSTIPSVLSPAGPGLPWVHLLPLGLATPPPPPLLLLLQVSDLLREGPRPLPSAAIGNVFLCVLFGSQRPEGRGRVYWIAPASHDVGHRVGGGLETLRL